jgi:hypothetical protein
MKTTLLLSDEPETARLTLKGVASGELTVRESEARAGCNCDRWGHPCPDCVERNVKPKAELSISRPVKQAR